MGSLSEKWALLGQDILELVFLLILIILNEFKRAQKVYQHVKNSIFITLKDIVTDMFYQFIQKKEGKQRLLWNKRVRT